MNSQFAEALEAFQGGDLDRARTVAESEIASNPSAEAHHLLGLIHCRLGDPVTGVEHLRLASEREPGNAGFRIMLMRAMVDAGRAADVLEMAEPPQIRSAVTLELWRARGEAADAAQDSDIRTNAWSKVANAAQNDWRAWANLASALTSQSRWAEAVDALNKAIRLNPSDASLRWTVAGALASAERHEESLAALDESDRLGGQTAESALARGRCMLAMMRFEEAEAAYWDAVRHAPDRVEAVRELGLLLERTSQLDSLVKLLDQASAAGIPNEHVNHLYAVRAFREGDAERADALLQSVDRSDDPASWHRTHAKVADRVGKTEEAFASAAEVNRLTPDFESWRSRGADYRKRLRDLGRLLTEMPELPQIEPPERRIPAFLVGFPRSGTTLLDTFLMGHPDTAVLEEVHLLGAAERQIGKVADLPRASVHALRHARDAYFSELDRNVPKGFSGLVVDKLPLNLLGAPFIEAIFPGAKIIFAQRHPCDAVLSGFMQSFVMNDAMASFLTIEDGADLYDAVMSGWRAMLERFDLSVHTVVYERLVVDAEAQLRPLIDFLGLPWDDRVLAHAETAKERGAIITPSYHQVTEPLNARAVGRWRRYEKQLESVLPVLLPWAEWLGYGKET
jgi:tetratricopeptide (TPR) repeat protein